MNNMISAISEYLSYPFIRYALIVGILISLSSSLLGVILVLKRFSFIGDGLSHVAFGALTIATIMNVDNNMIIVMPITVLCAVILLCTGASAKLKGDASLAMISVGALAIGYLLLNAFSSSSNIGTDVCSTLFGSTSILTLSYVDVWICAITSIIVIVAFVLLYNKIFSVTFDEAFATATGIRVKLYNLFIAVICAIVIVLAMNLVGSLLTSALIVFPAVSAMRLFGSFKKVVVSSAVISIASSFIGIIASLLTSTPVGAAIVVVNIIVFILCCLIGKIVLFKNV